MCFSGWKEDYMGNEFLYKIQFEMGHIIYRFQCK